MLKEIYQWSKKEISISLEQNKVNSIRKKNIAKTNYRVFENGVIGVAGALGKYDETTLMQKATEALGKGIEYTVPLSSNKKKTFSSKVCIPSETELLTESEFICYYLEKNHPDFICRGQILRRDNKTSLENDLDTSLSCETSFINFGIMFKEKTSLNIIDGLINLAVNNYNREDTLNYIDLILQGYKKKAPKLEDGKYPVVFSDQSFFIKFSSDLNCDLFGTGSSIFSDKLNTKVFNEKFTLDIDRNPETSMLCFFDPEGVFTQNYKSTLIKNGVIKTPFTSKMNAKKYGYQETGSSHCDYDEVPTQSSGYSLNFAPEITHDSLSNMLSENDSCIYVLISSGGDFTPEGVFGAPVQLSYLVKNGKVVGRLPELKLSSTVFDIYGDDYLGTCHDPFKPNNFDTVTVSKMDVTF